TQFARRPDSTRDASSRDVTRRFRSGDRREVIEPVAQYHIPGVFEQTNRGEKSYDLFSRMLEENIVFMGTPIDDYVANAVCAQMLYLEYKNPDKEISLYINSPGGDITALFAIYDTMKFVKNDISTFCYGQAASAAAVILAGGTPGKRYALPHARILIHQPYGGAAGQAADIEIQAKEILRMRDLLNQMVATDTGQDVDKVARDTDRDFIMSADEAKGYGIIDEVITTRELALVPQAAGVA
ncbi:MAG TPA: ATP-dependent Clp protease proteolytic subunit, partial [Acidimicrobiales bacterium]|nr:ATP-dependent Clp protease proteolytic subunit [Acidimicrobiales bacterium]